MPAVSSSLGRVGRLAGVVAAAVVAVGGCAPAPAPLSDPREILDRAAANLRDARTVHVDATIDGTLVLDAIVPGLSGGGIGAGGATGGGALSLTGTKVDGDLDLKAAAADLHLQIPALLGLTAELREVGGATYLTSSLTGKGWRRLDTGTLLAVGSGGPMAWVDGLRAWIQDPGVVPTRLDDGSCPAGSCYGVRLVVDRASLPDGAPLVVFGVSVQAGRLTLDLRVDRSSLRLSQLVVTADLGTAGSLESTISLSAWDAGVTIVPPPAGEVTSGPLFP